MEFRLVPAVTQWEPLIGYSRALRAGSFVNVSGTVALDETGEIVGRDDPYQQTRYVLRRIQQALAELDCKVSSVTRTRVYLKRIRDWQEVGRAYSEVFGQLKPTSTWLGVNELIHPDALIEIEVEAFIAS